MIASRLLLLNALVEASSVLEMIVRFIKIIISYLFS